MHITDAVRNKSSKLHFDPCIILTEQIGAQTCTFTHISIFFFIDPQQGLISYND